MLFAWNPLVLFEYCANSHNDILVVFFALLALFALTREHPVLAFACIIASASIKYATVPVAPALFLLWALPPVHPSPSFTLSGTDYWCFAHLDCYHLWTFLGWSAHV